MKLAASCFAALAAALLTFAPRSGEAAGETELAVPGYAVAVEVPGVMFHQRTDDFDIVLSNEAFRKKHGKDNPNVALIAALKDAGVEFRACGQAVVGREIDPKDVNPNIQIDLWAMTTFMNLQMKGFIRTGS